MAGVAEGMGELPQRLAGFNESVEQALEGRMLELEAEVDLIEPLPGAFGGVDSTSVDEDAELAARIARIAGR